MPEGFFANLGDQRPHAMFTGHRLHSVLLHVNSPKAYGKLYELWRDVDMIHEAPGMSRNKHLLFGSFMGVSVSVWGYVGVAPTIKPGYLELKLRSQILNFLPGRPKTEHQRRAG
jgi:hypothetical protein